MKTYKYPFAFFLFLLFPVFLFAQTSVPNLISSDQVWDMAGSPYYIGQNTLIEQNVKVTVKPGVTVKSTANYIKLMIDGEFQAIGTSDSTIFFDSIKITFNSDALDFNPNTMEGAFFNYCLFNTGGSPSIPCIETNTVSLRVINSSFENVYYALRTFGSSQSSSLIEIFNCSLEGDDGSGSLVDISDNNANADIQDCSFFNGRSVRISCNQIHFENNTAYRLSDVQFGMASSSRIACNSFNKVTNVVELKPKTSTAGKRVEFVNNTIDSAKSTSYNDPFRLYLLQPFNTDSLIIKNNNFLTDLSNDHKVAMKGYNSDPSSSVSVNIRDNYWGTTDSATIASYIKDYNDDITIKYEADFSSPLASMDTLCYQATGGGTLGWNTLENELKIYPNPATDKLFLNYSNQSIKRVEIYNLLGELMQLDLESYEKQKALDISSFADGIYILKVQWEDGTTAQQRFIKRS